MKITISGKPGAGKSTIAKLLAKKLNLKHYSIGDLMRKMAKEKNISLIELSKNAEKNPEIDKELDKKSEEIGKTQDNFVMDTRLGFHFIPDSIKIFLNISLDESAKRIFKDKRETEKAKTLEDLKFELKRRMDSEEKRYLEYYHIHINNPDNYDIIIDTTNLTVNKVLEKVLRYIKTFNF